MEAKTCRFPWCDNETKPLTTGTRPVVCHECTERFRIMMYDYKPNSMGSWFSSCYGTLKARAKKQNLPFDLVVEDLYNIFPQDGCCPIFKVPFSYGKGGQHKWSASVDKIIPELGYTKGNVQFVSMLANNMKCNSTEDELLIFCQHHLQEAT